MNMLTFSVIGHLFVRQSRMKKSVMAVCFSSEYQFNPKSNTDDVDCGNKLKDEELMKKRKMIEMDMELQRQTGNYFIPDNVKEKHWVELLKTQNASQRIRFYKYLKKIEIAIGKEKKKKEEKRSAYKARIEAEKNNPHLNYGLHKNSIFLKIERQTKVKFYNTNLLHASLFGQNIVFDFDYNEHMNNLETRSCVEQLQECFSFNRMNVDPFNIHFCNLKPEENLTKKLRVAIREITKPSSLISVTDQSYLNLFPKERLVYLSPDCRENLEFSHDDIYVIGCLVDRGNSKPLSLSKAKREGLRTGRLPLEKYVDWGIGRKALTIDQVMKILLSMKNTGNWKTAFQHIPKRKLRENS